MSYEHIDKYIDEFCINYDKQFDTYYNSEAPI